MFEILTYWLGKPNRYPEVNESLWWNPSPQTVQNLQAQFEDEVTHALKGHLEHWKESPHGCLALIVLLDQVTRLIYQNTPNAFAGDPQARETCLHGLTHSFDEELHHLEKAFFYCPLLHSEEIQLQEASYKKFEILARNSQITAIQSFFEIAQHNYSLIHHFGRFPQRNSLLGRTSSASEQEFLAQNTNSIGPGGL